MDHQYPLAITAANGFQFLPFERRLELYKEAGFTGVMPRWGGSSKERYTRTRLAEKHGLTLLNAHSANTHVNSIWLPGEEGEIRLRELIENVRDCASAGISVLVVHLSSGFAPPEANATGLSRLDRLFEAAAQIGVTVALENMRVPEPTRCVLDKAHLTGAGFCFDCGHANIWCRDTDWLSLYGDRIAAMHLHDNAGKTDDHLPLYEGRADLPALAARLAEIPIPAPLCIESEFLTGAKAVDASAGNIAGLRDFLARAYAGGQRFAAELYRIGIADK